MSQGCGRPTQSRCSTNLRTVGDCGCLRDLWFPRGRLGIVTGFARRSRRGVEPIVEQSRLERVRVKRAMVEKAMSAGAERVPGVADGGRLGRGRGGRMV